LVLGTQGMCVACFFAYACFREKERGGVVVGSIYAWDLLGGCVGSLLAILILIPFYGTMWTAGIMAILAAFCVFLVVS